MTRRLAFLFLAAFAIATPRGAPQLARPDEPPSRTVLFGAGTLLGAPQVSADTTLSTGWTSPPEVGGGAPLPAVASAASHEPMTPYALAPSRERPAEPGDGGLRVRSGGSTSTPATLDASAVTWEGTLAYALPSYGPRYLAIRQPRGTRVRLCGPAACLTRISTDFGPTLEMARQGRIADVSSVDFPVLCGVPLSFGVCNGTLTLVGLPATDLEGSHD